LTAPVTMKKTLLDKIDREIDIHSNRNPGLIRFKSNAIEDPEIVDALYRASRAGVKVELVVRDSCRLRPGLPGLSENITVTSIVGRFLEHTRIFYFKNGGKEEYYIGSADLMTRNLEHRVEVLTPVEAPELRRELKEMLDLQLKDNRSGWDMLADGSYVQRKAGRTRNGSQQKLISAANKRDGEANRLKKSKLNSIARRASK
ncbi:MAG TPA: RNA degradosome polyphosphate kinase, partial [Rhodospirillales bacterium]|nr:RNA degradosome polyphosphate kinase [Rhodospirillales bacterium]